MSEGCVMCSFISDDFDPAAIADKLRAVADNLHEDTLFKAALNDLRKAAMQEVSLTKRKC